MVCSTATARPRARPHCRRRRPGDHLRFLYLLAVYLAAPLISLVLLWRGLWDRSYWRNFGERFGFGAALAARRGVGARGVGG